LKFAQFRVIKIEKPALVSGRIKRLWTGVFASGRFPGTLKSGIFIAIS
jgi:hypothetical protein